MPTPKKGAAKAKSHTRAKKAMAPVVELRKVNADPKAFYDSIDWEEWFHEFSTERLRRGGTYLYASTFAFAKAKGKTQSQRDLILHIIGPVIAGRSTYKDIPQFDWETRRRAGFWLGPEPLKNEIAKITEHTDSLLELKESARAALLPLLLQVSNMFAKIESAFGGQLTLPGASLKDNETRVALYMRLVDQTVAATIRLQQAYALALGVNVSDAAGTLLLREASTIGDKNIALEGAKRTIGQIIEMTVAKGAALGLPLPDPEIGEIVQRQKSA